MASTAVASNRYDGWSAPKLMDEQARLVEKLLLLTRQLSTAWSRGYVAEDGEENMSPYEQRRQYKNTLRTRDDRLNISAEPWQSNSTGGRGMPQSKDGGLQTGASRTPPRTFQGDGKGRQGAKSASGKGGSKASARNRDQTPLRGKGDARSASPNSKEVAKMRNELGKQFSNFKRPEIGKALEDTGFDMKKSRKLLRLMSDFTDMSRKELFGLLEDAEWDEAGARYLYEEKVAAATTIQSAARGKSARKQVNQLREDPGTKKAQSKASSKPKGGAAASAKQRSAAADERKEPAGAAAAAKQRSAAADERKEPAKMKKTKSQVPKQAKGQEAAQAEEEAVKERDTEPAKKNPMGKTKTVKAAPSRQADAAPSEQEEAAMRIQAAERGRQGRAEAKKAVTTSDDAAKNKLPDNEPSSANAKPAPEAQPEVEIDDGEETPEEL